MFRLVHGKIPCDRFLGPGSRIVDHVSSGVLIERGCGSQLLLGHPTRRFFDVQEDGYYSSVTTCGDLSTHDEICMYWEGRYVTGRVLRLHPNSFYLTSVDRVNRETTYTRVER